MQESICCLECGQSFDGRRSLHAHIKAHKMTLGDYYVKNLPKFDLFSGEPIPFKNYEAYIETDFRNKKNMYKWLQSISDKERSEYCLEAFDRHMRDRKVSFTPNHLYFMTHPRLPKKCFFSDLDIAKISEKYGMRNVFTDRPKERINLDDYPKDMIILQDTAEQKPLKFSVKSVETSLDFGDYTSSGKEYKYVYVERKSESDFKGTMSAGFERFCRELERAREFDSYIYIVVESDFGQIYRNNKLPFNKGGNLDFIWDGMRKIIASYSDVCQFMFTGSRENSARIIPYLLYNGWTTKKIDMQYYLEESKCLG